MNSLYILIKGCIDNDQKCQQRFYEHYYGFALKTVFRYIFLYEKATDIVNDGFVKIFNNLPKFNLHKDSADTEKMLMGWMKRIFINTAIDELRRIQSAPVLCSLPDYIWEECDRSQNADRIILYKELMTEVKQLPPSYRTVFNLFVIDGYSHAEIGQLLGISEGTSKSALAKAKAQLKKFLNKRLLQSGYEAAIRQ